MELDDMAMGGKRYRLELSLIKIIGWNWIEIDTDIMNTDKDVTYQAFTFHKKQDFL